MPLTRSNFIIEIATAVPRRLTPYRGRTSAGTRGLIVGGLYYKAAIVEVPEIEENEGVAPLTVTISLGNATNQYTDLFSDPANLNQRITISKIDFPVTVWNEAFPPTGTVTPWFEGLIGSAMPNGTRLELQCRADMGRRGPSPKTKSRTLMTSHQPLTKGQAITVIVRTAGTGSGGGRGW